MSDPKAIVAEAQEAENRGDLRKASALYSTAAVSFRQGHRYRDARSLFKRAIGLSPQSARLYVQLALTEIALANDEAAVAALEKFTEVTVHRGKIDEYRPYLEKHLAAYPSLRQIFYRGLLKIDRMDAGPFMDYAQAAVDKGDWEEARLMLIDALKTKSREQEVLEKLGDVLRAMEGQGDALKAIESFRAGRLAFKELLPLLAPRGRRGGAEGPAGEGTEAPPPAEEDLDGLIKRLEGEMGVSLQERHDTVKPLVTEFRRQAGKAIGKDTKTRIDLAMSFFGMGLVEDARDELSKVPVSDERFLEAQALLGEILVSEGSWLEALEIYQRCLRDERIGEDLAGEAAYQLAHIYDHLGDLRQALRWAEKLEKRSPTYRDIRQLRKGLEEKARARGGKE